MGRAACTEPQCLYKGDLYLTFYSIVSVNQIYFILFYFYFAVKVFTYSVILDPRIYEIVRSAKFQLAQVPF